MTSHNLRLLMMFRGCRLCGSGGGVKFPVAREEPQLQPLKHKIKEVVGIEIKANDKMPPLVCEVCLDKVLEFYDFKMLCQKTEETNRKNLNLNPQKRPICEGECIFGMTERLFPDEDNSTSQKGKNAKKRKSTPAPQTSTSVSARGLRRRQPEELQLNTRRRGRLTTQERAKSESTNSDDEFLIRKKVKPKKVSFSIETRRKKSASPSPPPTPTPAKKARRAAEPPAPPAKSANLKKSVPRRQPAAVTENKRTSTGPDPGAGAARNLRGSVVDKATKAPASKASASKQKVSAAVPEPRLECEYCGLGCKSGAALYSHKRVCHLVGYTDVRLTCNPCALWFTSVGDTRKHHAWHRRVAEPYRCNVCHDHFAAYTKYKEHRETRCEPPPLEIKFNVPEHVVAKCKQARVVICSFDKILSRLQKVNETTYKDVDEGHSFAAGIVYPFSSRGPFEKPSVPTLLSISFKRIRALIGLPGPAVDRLFHICMNKMNDCLIERTTEPISRCSSNAGADFSFDSKGTASTGAEAENDENTSSAVDIIVNTLGKADTELAEDECNKADSSTGNVNWESEEDDRSKTDNSTTKDDCDMVDAESAEDDRSKTDNSTTKDDCDVVDAVSAEDDRSKTDHSRAKEDCDMVDAESAEDDRSKADRSTAKNDCDMVDAELAKDDRSKADHSTANFDCDKADSESAEDDCSKADLSKANDDCDMVAAESAVDDRSKADHSTTNVDCDKADSEPAEDDHTKADLSRINNGCDMVDAASAEDTNVDCDMGDAESTESDCRKADHSTGNDDCNKAAFDMVDANVVADTNAEVAKAQSDAIDFNSKNKAESRVEAKINYDSGLNSNCNDTANRVTDSLNTVVSIGSVEEVQEIGGFSAEVKAKVQEIGGFSAEVKASSSNGDAFPILCFEKTSNLKYNDDKTTASIIGKAANRTAEIKIASKSEAEAGSSDGLAISPPRVDATRDVQILENTIEETLQECENSNNLNLELEYERQQINTG